MAIDNRFMIKKIQSKTHLYAAYCAVTNMPLVICDEETFDDQVWLFETQELLQEFAKPHLEKKLLLRGVEYKNRDFLKFFSSLYLMGINALVYVGSAGEVRMQLEDLVRKPDYSKLAPQQRPVTNPNLVLTGLYFMQEAGRAVPQDEKENLQDLEEEFASNLVKSRYILAVEFLDGPGSMTEKLKNQQYRLPILKDKNGKVLQPAFTDPMEFEKFSKGKKLGAIAAPFAQLSRLLVKDAEGFILNPAGFHIIMPRQLLEALKDQFQQPEEGTDTGKENGAEDSSGTTEE